jgi:hypothetical protein
MFRTNPYFICIKIVTKMGGIEAAEEMTPEQLDALSGGELLRQEASSFTQVSGSIPPAEEMTPEQLDALSGRWQALAPGSLFLHTGIGFYSSS